MLSIEPTGETHMLFSLFDQENDGDIDLKEFILGMCNFVTRIFTAISPILAQIEEPLPVIIFLILSMLGCSVVWGI